MEKNWYVLLAEASVAEWLWSGTKLAPLEGQFGAGQSVLWLVHPEGGGACLRPLSVSVIELVGKICNIVDELFFG